MSPTSQAKGTGDEGQVRKRKKQKAGKKPKSNETQVNGSVDHRAQIDGDADGSEQPHRSNTDAGSHEDYMRTVISIVTTLSGMVLLVLCGAWFTWYVYTLHENNLWFSNIQEVEQEISFRTESGLYYSYYKQLMKPGRSFNDRIVELTRDNSTEHGRTINVLARFNVYQEVILAALYRLCSGFLSSVRPIFFYVYAVFALSGLYVSVLYATSWFLTGSWMAGLFAALQFIVNLEDTTRVFFTVNLRECFAFPCFFIQIFFICVYLERGTSKRLQGVCQLSILAATFFFALFWQFNQFILLLQAITFHILGTLQLAPLYKMRQLLLIHAVAILIVGALQFFQPMLLASLLLSFIPVSIMVLYVFRNVEMRMGILEGSFRLGFQAFLTVSLTLLLNAVIKYILKVEADEHIFKFLRGKFGFGNPLDFESRIYLCHGAFIFLDNDFFKRTTMTFLLPFYFATVLGVLFLIGKNMLLEWCSPVLPPDVAKKHESQDPTDASDKAFFPNQRPSISFLVIESVLAGILALMTLRMKYFWTPHMIILASVGMADKDVWENVLTFVRSSRRKPLVQGIRYVLPILLVTVLASKTVPRVQHQISDLREFWDPDTVELMQWINNSTAETASFAGSMQLLAGVKCCTGRHLINHPHFEDKWLRDRTKEVYQVYARRHPDEVYQLLEAMDVHYVIIEDSICLARSVRMDRDQMLK